jgi:hypothetical protein
MTQEARAGGVVDGPGQWGSRQRECSRIRRGMDRDGMSVTWASPPSMPKNATRTCPRTRSSPSTQAWVISRRRTDDIPSGPSYWMVAAFRRRTLKTNVPAPI